MAAVKVQAIYEKALAVLGKTEEGTDYPLADRVPALLGPYIQTINLYRDEANKIPAVKTLQDKIELTDREAEALAYCLAAVAGSEAGISQFALKIIFENRNALMGAFTGGFEDIGEGYLL